MKLKCLWYTVVIANCVAKQPHNATPFKCMIGYAMYSYLHGTMFCLTADKGFKDFHREAVIHPCLVGIVAANKIHS